MFKIEVSETTLNDLKIFLSRTDLKGLEVPAYAEIMKSIYNATPVNKLKEEETTKEVGD